MAIIERDHWIDKEGLTTFILQSQDLDGRGGIADRPGDEPDVFHTFFGLSALSLMGFSELQRIDPVYALPAALLS